ncbi:MAG: hypothetical protein HC902_10770, partial [Calothrix sp. SM1_5_4]|nr:hypothetical protein [Calothrix sp. SM1_5_4]
MKPNDLELSVRQTGERIFKSLDDESSPLFSKDTWYKKIMDWSMKNEHFKVQMFRFVDVLPYLQSSSEVAKHLKEYFAESGDDLPSVFSFGLGIGSLAPGIMAGAIKKNVTQMAKLFITGESPQDALPALKKARKNKITFTADLGQGEELEPARAKALALGVKPEHIFIEDLREDFVRDYVFPMFRANALYEGLYLLGTSIARPLIAKRQIEIAALVGADAVAHGATGKGNDQCRFEFTYAALAPDLKVIAPWKMEEYRALFPGRAEMIAYCQKHNIPVEASLKKPYSMDRNLLHISFEAGAMEDPWYDATTPADKDMYVLSVSPEDAPDQPEYVEILFEKGNAIGLKHPNLDAILTGLGDVKCTGTRDGHALLSPYGVMRVLNVLGGRNGIGRVDIVATASGRIVPAQGSQIIQPLAIGVVQAIHVRQWRHVEA